MTTYPLPFNTARHHLLVQLPDDQIFELAVVADWLGTTPGGTTPTLEDFMERQCQGLDRDHARQAVLGFLRTCLAMECDDAAGCQCAVVQAEVERRYAALDPTAYRTPAVYDGLLLPDILTYFTMVEAFEGTHRSVATA